MVSSDLGEPDVEEDGHPYHIECERYKVPAAAVSRDALTRDQVLVLVIEGQFVIPTEVSIETDGVADEAVV